MKVCVQCGVVIQEVMIVEAMPNDNGRMFMYDTQARIHLPRNDATATTYVLTNQSYVESKKKDMMVLLSNCADSLHLPARIADRSKFLFDAVQTMLQIGFGDKGITGLSVCLYLAAREACLPVSIGDVCCVFHVDQSEFAKSYFKLLPSIPVSLPACDAEALITMLCRVASQGQKEQDIQKDALAMLRIAKTGWLHVGRRSSGLAVACAVIGIESESGRKTSSRTMQFLCNAAKCSESIVNSRYTEFKHLLLSLCKHLPFFADVKSGKAFCAHLKDLLRFAEMTLAENTIECLPPAFLKSVEHRAEMQSRIQRAEKRIQIMQDPEMLDALLLMPENTDRKDELIEQLILEGCSAEEIMSYKKIFKQNGDCGV